MKTWTIPEGTATIERLHRLYSGAHVEVIAQAVEAGELTPDDAMSLFHFCYGPTANPAYVLELLQKAYENPDPRLQRYLTVFPPPVQYVN